MTDHDDSAQGDEPDRERTMAAIFNHAWPVMLCRGTMPVAVASDPTGAVPLMMVVRAAIAPPEMWVEATPRIIGMLRGLADTLEAETTAPDSVPDGWAADYGGRYDDPPSAGGPDPATGGGPAGPEY